MRLSILIVIVLLAFSSQARDARHTFPVADVFDNEEFAGRIDDVQFFFAGEETPAVAEKMGEYQANKKTNAFGKDDNEACAWAFLSALQSLHDRALKEGGDAVIDVYSYYKRDKFESPDEYECGAGAIMAGVTLKGTVVKLK